MSHTGRGSERVRVMLYSHNGVGLGHLRRNINIATRFVSELPGSSVLLLTGCPLGDFFQLPPGVDFIKIPSIIKIDTEPRRFLALSDVDGCGSQKLARLRGGRAAAWGAGGEVEARQEA